jgi:hypothetical protein
MPELDDINSVAALLVEPETPADDEREAVEGELVSDAADLPKVADDDAPEGETDGDTERSDDADAVELEFAGEKVKLPKAVAEHVTREREEIGKSRANVDAYLQHAQLMAQATEVLADRVADTKLLEREIKQYEGVAWDRIEMSERAYHMARLNELRMQHQQASQAVNALKGEIGQAHIQALEKRLEEEVPKIRAAIKGFDPAYANRLEAYARKVGFTNAELANVRDSRYWITLDKAMKYDGLSPGGIIKSNAAPPKAIATPKATAKAPDAKQVMAKLKQSGGNDTRAIAALLAGRI